MTNFDPAILQTYADKLYSRAEWIRLKYLLLGILLGGGLGVVPFALNANPSENQQVAFGICLAVGLFGGISSGNSKSWELKFRAQQLLLLMQIELNTRTVVANTRSKTAGV